MAVVMVPNTGAVLLLAHYPFFNPNALNDFSQELWMNRILTDPLEPGSTMKIFSAAAAIESGSSSPNSIFYCENGTYASGKYVSSFVGFLPTKRPKATILSNQV